MKVESLLLTNGNRSKWKRTSSRCKDPTQSDYQISHIFFFNKIYHQCDAWIIENKWTQMMWIGVVWASAWSTFDASIELFGEITEISFHQIVSYAQWGGFYFILEQYGTEYG